jgi:hypothetical protein
MIVLCTEQPIRSAVDAKKCGNWGQSQVKSSVNFHCFLSSFLNLMKFDNDIIHLDWRLKCGQKISYLWVKKDSIRKFFLSTLLLKPLSESQLGRPCEPEQPRPEGHSGQKFLLLFITLLILQILLLEQDWKFFHSLSREKKFVQICPNLLAQFFRQIVVQSLQMLGMASPKVCGNIAIDSLDK